MLVLIKSVVILFVGTHKYKNTIQKENITYMHAITKFKEVVGRASAFTLAVALLGGVMASALPATAFADALNPLTERTLTLTSSSPGFHYLDGSGNSTYAPPGSGPNGKQTGERYSFKVSTDSSASGTNVAIQAFTFQFCTTAAGFCSSPGNNAGNDNPFGGHTPDRGADTTTSSDLSVNYTTPVQNTDFEIYVGGVRDNTGGWAMTVANKEDGQGAWTSQNNFITLAKAGSVIKPTSGTQIEVVFKASMTNYITNPGYGAFFVKINTFNSATNTDPLVDTANIIDGGVTVANVMTDSIQIQTKVLETMSFSVGTQDPDTVDPTQNGTVSDSHGPCDLIEVNEDINLGDDQAEYSLSPSVAYDGHSYWRLSSNSSGGATVYYSGATLSNTVGDQINAVGTTAAISHPGMEQFGLAYDSTADALDNRAVTGMVDLIAADALLPADQKVGYEAPHLTPLVAGGAYDLGIGDINDDTVAANAEFAFDDNSLTNAVPFATYNADVIKCSTGKMRYLANISPNTPAGVYTTKLNYLAAPQY